MERKNYKKYTIIISILCLLLIAVNAVNISFAYFTDKKSSSSESFLKFGTIDINAYFIKDATNTTEDFTFSSSDVSTGSQIVRKIGIKNQNNAQKCAVRMYYEFKVSKDNGATYVDVSDKNYLQLAVANTSNWKTNQKWFYYNSSLDTGESLEETLTFTVKENFSKDNLKKDLNVSELSTLKYTLKLCCEAVQVVNGGVAEWSGQTPAGWNVN